MDFGTRRQQRQRSSGVITVEAVVDTGLNQKEELEKDKNKPTEKISIQSYDPSRISSDGSLLPELNSGDSTKLVYEKTDPCCNPENGFLLPHPVSVDSSEGVQEEETENIIQELCHCLPAWVSRDQMLGLVSGSRRNIVEIVNHFYERETEFYEQVSTCTSSASASQASLANETAVSQGDLVNGIQQESVGVYTKKFNNSLSLGMSTKYSNSAGKRPKSSESKPSKRQKGSLQQERTGPKQCTITRFFNKVMPTGSTAAGLGSKTPE